MIQMLRLLSRGSRVVSGALALTLSLVSVATCFAGTLQLTEPFHRASCHGMQTEDGTSKVGTLDRAPDCCAVQHAVMGLGGASEMLGAPLPTTAVLVRPSPLDTLAFDSRASISSSPPTYLLISVFRV